jgi:hypothetical protein
VQVFAGQGSANLQESSAQGGKRETAFAASFFDAVLELLAQNNT